jgi:hypothetical protein
LGVTTGIYGISLNVYLNLSTACWHIVSQAISLKVILKDNDLLFHYFPSEHENDLVALIPVRDNRLKPRRTYVAMIIYEV